MSHFTVLVIGPDVEKQLAPYHEFECTGTDDEYVQDIDETEEARAGFASATTTRLKAPDGTLHSFFNEAGEWRPEFSQLDPERPSFDTNRRTYFVPPGHAKVEVPVSQVEGFAQWVEDYYGRKPVAFGSQPDLQDEHKYGYVLLDQAGEPLKIVRRTNPNKKWDWYQIGGRWSGFFKLKDGSTGVRGERGVMGSSRSNAPGRADQLTKGAIDIAGMRDDAGREAGERWDKAAVAIAGREWHSWAKCRDEIHKGAIDAARNLYNGQDAVKAIHAAFDSSWIEADQFQVTRDAYVSAARSTALSTYAVVYKGEWSARGEMGWFGCSDDKVSQDAWDRLFNDLIDGLPDDTQITVVDCHI